MSCVYKNTLYFYNNQIKFQLSLSMQTLIKTFMCLLLLPAAVWAQTEPTVIPLWPNGAPGFENRRNEPEQAKDYWVKNIHNPSLTVFTPPAGKANGAAVVICPGG